MLKEIRKELENPKFNKCFPVIGSMGSGKTHFVSNCLSEKYEEDISKNNQKTFTIIVDYDEQKSVKNIILDKLEEITKHKWQDFYDIHTYLLDNYNEPKLFFVFDSIDKWTIINKNFYNEIHDLIIEYNNCYTIYWVFTINNIHYDSFCYKFDNMWKRYSYFYDRKNIKEQYNYLICFDGWINLDEVNKYEKIGEKIIIAKLQIPSSDYLFDIRKLKDINKSENHLDYIQNPSIALVYADSAQNKSWQIDNFIDMYFLDFVEKLFIKKCNRLMQHISELSNKQITYDTIQSSLYLIAKFFSGNKDIFYCKEQIYPYLNENIDYSLRNDGIDIFINSLVYSNLLNKLKNPECTTFTKILLTCYFFWSWLLCKYLFCGIKNDAHEQLIDNLKLAIKSDILIEGLLEFYFLKIDEEFNNIIHPNFSVWTNLIEDKSFDSSPIWFSLRNSSFKLNEYITKKFLIKRKSRLHFSEKRELFSYMLYLYSLPFNFLRCNDILFFLQENFDSIRNNYFTDIYLTIVKKVLILNNDEERLLKCMKTFSGCEVLNIGNELSRICLTRLIEMCNNDINKILNIIIKYLDIQTRRKNKLITGKSDESGNFKRITFRENIIFEFCQYLFKNYGHNSFNLLYTNNWYNKPLKCKNQKLLTNLYIVAREKEKEANIAFGTWFRFSIRNFILSGKSISNNQFVKIVEKLSNSSNSHDREIAFHLIRHSELIVNNKEPKVNHVFYPFLKKLEEDKDLYILKEKFNNFFKRNL